MVMDKVSKEKQEIALLRKLTANEINIQVRECSTMLNQQL